MTTQIAVRLPDDIVKYIDQEIADGTASSRAAVVLRALERDRRRQEAEHDARIYAADPDSEFDDLAAWAARRPMDID
ncbi:hypothetical protein AB0K00_16515 [Dactylosporangium sp. NPDC049525]|uniref:hypothetical protein n=1 Tax=Dactylosporangium sp. NPDC049525 TaxID=3154730 RepID=UPI00343B457B